MLRESSSLQYFAEMGKQSFIWVRKSQILKVLGSFRYHKSANSLGVPFYKLAKKTKIFTFNLKSRMQNYLHNTTQLCLKMVLKVVYLGCF